MRVVGVAVVVVGMLAMLTGGQNYCCLPQQWEGDVATFTEFGNQAGYAFIHITNDYTTQRFRYDIFANNSGYISNLTMWDAYKQVCATASVTQRK